MTISAPGGHDGGCLSPMSALWWQFTVQIRYRGWLTRAQFVEHNGMEERASREHEVVCR